MITPLPIPPQRSDSANFASRADAFLTALPLFGDEANALALEVENDATNATTQAQLAASSASAAASSAVASASSASAAAASANTAAASAGGQLWVSGATYAVGALVFSALTGRNYRRIVAGAGTTDPSADSTNWRAVLLDISTLMPTIRPSLLLDFANSKQVDPRITFTRSSTATYFDAQGVLRTAASGVPRIDNDPVTGECKGLLVEEQRTNLLTYSEQFGNAAWGKTDCTISSDAEVAPDGTTTADAAINTGNIISLIERTIAVTASSTNDYYASIFVKPISPNAICTLNTYYSGETETNITFYFNTKTIAGILPYAGEYIFDALPNGWFRIGYRVVRNTTGTTTQLLYRLWPSGRDNTTGGCYIWGAQIEAGAFPTSYIPTTTAQVTRTADVANMTGANFSSWYRQGEGTFYVEASCANGTVSTFIYVGSDDSNRIQIANDGASNSISRIVNGGAAANPASTSAPTGGAKYALAYKQASAAATTDGLPVVTSSPTAMVAHTAMRIGSNAASGLYANGTIRRIAYYPKRLSNAELQALTTP